VIQPGDKTSTSALVIAGDKARFTNEQDIWRLFDTKARTVTFVDDVARTVRTEPLEALQTRRRTAPAAELPVVYPRARVTRNGTKKAMHGVNAELTIVEVGGYRRELWLADHPSIPGDLYALIQASEAPSSPLAPMMRQADEELLKTKGFPLADHGEIAYGTAKSIVDRQVLSIVQRDVPEATISVPQGYKDVTPPTAPAVRRRPAS
jgi:hypothetical protein